jgi:hypothetical protein
MSDDLTRAMQAAAQDLTPDISKLTSGGIERGVRRRRVRRISQIAGAAASVTAVFAVVAAVAPGSGAPASAAAGGGPDPAALVATTQAAAVGGAPKPAPSASTTPGSDPHRTAVPPKTAPSAPPVGGEDMVKWLKQEVAPLNFSDVSVLKNKGTEGLGGPYAVLKVGYSAGVGNVAVRIQSDNWDNMGFEGPPVPYITIKNESDGSHVMIYNGPEWPQGNGNPTGKRLDATWYRNDGVSVTVEGINESTEKGATTATAVPLTPEQAEAIAKSPVWNAAAASTAYQAYVDHQQFIANNGKQAGSKTATPAAGSGS